MKRYLLITFLLLGLAAAAWLVYSPSYGVSAQSAADTDIPRGAALYDKWYAVLGVQPPAGNSPLWAKQTTNTRSGEDTWRCISCHGWDYQGRDGAYRPGSNQYTGFPGVYTAASKMDVEQLADILAGSLNEDHDFSAFLDQTARMQLAAFLKNGLVDDAQYIDPRTFKVLGGVLTNGQALYDAECAKCHGEDGEKLMMRFEGMDAGLGTLSAVDPWRFLHKTRFGTPGTEMVIGYTLGWTAQEGRDVLLYAQTLPGGNQRELQPSVIGEGEVVATPLAGGPPKGSLGGILAALGAMATALGFNIIIIGALVGILLLVVVLLRQKK